MSPPTEQLIRDYLNRLSVAARGRLNAEDRQALVMRTRDFIERKASSSAPANPMQVAALLSRLGDPAVLVNQEVARLAAVRGEPAPPPESSEGGRRLGLLRRRSGQASRHWPRPAGSPDLQVRLLNGARNQAGEIAAGQAGPEVAPGRPPAEPSASAAEPSVPGAEPSASAAEPSVPAAEQNPPAAEPTVAAAQHSAPREPPIWVPRQAPAPDTLTSESAGRPGQTSAASAVGSSRHPEPARLDTDRLPPASAGRPSWPSVVAMSGASADPAGAEMATTGAELDEVHDGLAGTEPGRPVLRTTAALLGNLIRRARQNPVEAVAVALLGLGGAVYPPVWLLGAVVALASKEWDYRDKWVGLAGPVLLLVVGTTAGVSLTEAHASMSSFMHESWMYADVLSRVGAVLGAAYLAWRVSRGRRGPAVPPWNKPRKLG